ncbi:MAG: hypothetical protein U9O94_02760 [Nanoarchaeota archaeon]|nr:hypothetical protein [Nanoarchaeota archaeon]
MAKTLQERISNMEGYLKNPTVLADKTRADRIRSRLAEARAELGAQQVPSKTELPFPKTQEEMAEYQEMYTFDGGRWHKEIGQNETYNANDFSDIGAGEMIKPTDTSTPNGSNAITSATGISDMMKSMTASLKQQQDALAKANEQQQTWIDKLTGKKQESKADLLAKQHEQWGTADMFKQIQDITNLTLPLQQQLADLSNRETAEIERVSGMGMSESWRDRKTYEIQDKYNRLKAPIATQLNAYAAQSQTIQGNLSIANQFMTQAVNAAVYDQEYEYNRTKDMIDMNQDFIDGLKADEKWLFTNMLNMREDELSIARKEKTDISNLMLQYPNAGISLGDTYDEAVSKASRWSGAQPTTTGAPTVIGTEKTGYKQWDATTGTWISIEGMGGISEEGWTDEKIRVYVRSMAADGMSRQQIMDEFEIDPTVTDKARARLIIGELLDVKKDEPTKKGLFDRFKRTPGPTAAPLTDKQVKSFEELGLPVPKKAPEYYVPGGRGIDIGITESFFNQLNY